MWQSKPQGHANVIAPAIAAALSSVLCRKIATRPAEMLSEILCWMLLPLLFKLTKSVNSQDALIKSSNSPFANETKSDSGFVCSVFAVGVAFASFCKAENGVIGFLPMQALLVLVIQRHFQPELYSSSRKTSSLAPEALVNSVWGYTLGAILATYALSSWSVSGFAASIGALAGSTLAYVTLLRRQAKADSPTPPIQLQQDINVTAPRTIIALLVMLALKTAIFGYTGDQISIVLLLAGAKALCWYFTIQTAQLSTWTVSPLITSFGMLASIDPFIQSFESDVLLYLFGSLMTLGQLIYVLPSHSRSRRFIWMLFLVPLVPYCLNRVAITSAINSTPKYNDGQMHPVGLLIEKAGQDFNSELQHQSTSHSEAEETYRKRYKMDPPAGFKQWYEFALANKSPLIDNFDTIYSSISRLWKLSGHEVRQLMKGVQADEDSDVWHCQFKGNDGKTSCNHLRRTFDRHTSQLFEQLLGDITSLPDVEFLVNHLDEPRVLFPKGTNEDKTSLNYKALSHQSTWETLTQACDLKSEYVDIQRIETYGIPFVENVTSMMDLCQHPEYNHMHGLFQSPTSFQLIQGLVPVLSTGSPWTMNDILYPSAAYIESEFQYDSSRDIDWHEKRNNMYWAGSTSGAYSALNQWKQYQRQRFVEFAQNLPGRNFFYLRQVEGKIQRVASSFLNGRLFDVIFTRVFQCETHDCRAQHAYFRMRSWADKDEALKSKLTFDLDGNGISGRYYKLLASNSVPLKQTLLREWHDDRHKPWVHYIPISQSMEELPELVFYLTSTEAGQRHAKQIADNGRDWFQKAFRQADMAVYVYRLLLELARLQNPERPAQP